jgi:hypothetical protein
MKLLLFFVIFVAASFFAAAADDDNDNIIKNLDKFLDDCHDLKETVRSKCHGLLPEPSCLRCALKGCSNTVGQEHFCKNLNDCVAKNPTTC